jgi:hypothetical protein
LQVKIMGILDDLLGNTSADAAKAAAADTYKKQQAAIGGLNTAGDQYATGMSGLAKGYDPYAQAGTGALSQLMNGLGLNGSGGSQQFTDAYRATPGYQAGLDTGINSATRGANATGMLQSGRTLKALDRFGSDYEDQKSGQYLDRLTGMANTGLTATGAQVGTEGQGLTGQLGARTTAFGGGMQSAGTIGQGDVAAAQAKQGALTNLMSTAAYLGGAALGGPMGASLGKSLTSSILPYSK